MQLSYEGGYECNCSQLAVGSSQHHNTITPIFPWQRQPEEAGPGTREAVPVRLRGRDGEAAPAHDLHHQPGLGGCWVEFQGILMGL